MSERQYVTELRVNAPTDQVVKLNDALRNVQNTIQAIRSAGPVSPAVGGVGAGGGAGAGGVGPSGPGAPGGAAQGWPGGGGGSAGGWGGGGRGLPPGGGGPSIGQRAQRIGDALPTTGQGAVVGAAAAIGGLVGMGAFTGAIAADYLRSVDKAVQTDRARSRLRGLTGGAVGAIGGTELGYTPAEAAEIATQAAQTGVGGAGNVRDLARIAMQMERMGIGAGAGMGLAGAFALGGGAAGGPGMAADAVRATFGLAVKMGLETAQIPALLEKVAGATTAMAEQGADVDVANVLRGIAQVREMGGGAQALAGTRSAAVFESIAQLARTVAGGGGTPIQQEVLLRAAGLGQIDPATGRRIDLVGAYERLESLSPADLARSVIGQGRMAGAGDPRAAALFMARTLGIGGIGQMLALAEGGGTGAGYTGLVAGGRRAMAQRAGAATSGLMARGAAMEARDVALGFQGADAVFTLRETFQGLRQSIGEKLITPMVNEAAKIAQDAAKVGLTQAMLNFAGRAADPAKGAGAPPGAKWDANRKMWFVPDPKAPANPAPQSMPGMGGKGWQGNLMTPGGTFRLELAPGVEDFFRLVHEPGVPA